MTNSHNRSTGGRSTNPERYYNSNGSRSPPQTGYFNNNGKRRGQKSPSATYFNSITSSSPSSSISSSPPKLGNGRNSYNSSTIDYYQQNQNGRYYNNQNSNNSRSSPGGSSTLSTTPPNFSKFAGSECFDSPSPTALPRPPSHWTTAGKTCTAAMAASNKKFDDFSHNLKLILNVQA